MFKTDLFGGHVSKEQLKLVLMQPPLFRGHSELTITNLAGTGRWNYLDLDKLKHRKLSLVCLGFTSMNVHVRVHLGITKCQELHLEAMSLRYYALCTLTRGQWGGTDVWCYIWVLFWGCRDLLS
jgi:hypothetical protein